jgi:5-oxoprolinase (ATP-hydrolysing) subunit C
MTELPERPLLDVVRVLGLVTVQDLGRPGHMHEAVPQGGALARDRLAAANGAAGNTAGAPALEVLGELVVRARASVVIGTDTHGARVLRAGDEHVVHSAPRRCAYLAVRGGIAAPLVLGGRGTLLCAGLGRAIQAGHVIATTDAFYFDEPTPSGELASSAARADAPIRIVPGPDLDAFPPDGLAVLTSAAYRVLPSSDRVGTRLAGAVVPRLPGYRERSRPMVEGALEIPGDGLPIALGPEHPTTGGYPVIAVIASAELGRFHAIALGASVRFTLAEDSVSGSR